MKYQVIYSADHIFQVLKVVRGNSDDGWNEANRMYKAKELQENHIEHYDVIELDTINEMNAWIFEQVGDSRKMI